MLRQDPGWVGPAYWSRFPAAAAAGWAEPTFFPVAVFYGKPAHTDALAQLGINTFVGVEHDGTPMSAVTGRGISVIAQREWTSAEVGSDEHVVGWHISDECEMGYSGCNPDGRDIGEEGRLEIQEQYAASARALNDGRFIHANFGNGVLRTYWAPKTMEGHIALVDASSVDKYAYTSPHVRDLIRASPDFPASADPERAATYGWLARQMRRFQTEARPIPNWVAVETAKPYLSEHGARSIRPDEISGAVWSAIVNGAQGIMYFQHNNGKCGNYSLVECSAELRQEVAAINAEILSLAPILNSPTYEADLHTRADTLLKLGGDSWYVFATLALGAEPGKITFSLPPRVSARGIEVVGEQREIGVNDSTFADNFPTEGTHHVYRLIVG